MTQGPHCKRDGLPEDFDWTIECEMAAAYQKATPNSVIYVASAFQQTGSLSELDFYAKAFGERGIPNEALVLDPRGFETVVQCERAVEFAKKESARLVIFCTYFHFLRVLYLCRGNRAKYCVVWGTPGKGLTRMHLVFTVLFPCIDLLGFRRPYLAWVERRRLKGIQ